MIDRMMYITGDTHGEIDIQKLNGTQFKEQKNMVKQDYVIIAGDFGFVWKENKSS
jgi:predicted phosphodiesterase